MNVTKKFLPLLALAALFTPKQAVHAGPYSDDLSKCIIESTTVNDRAAFVNWIFSAASLHPAVKSIAAVPKEQMAAANRQTGEMVMKILTESCPKQAEKAIRYEGASALETSFEALGQVAGQELFSSPEVAAGMAGLVEYLDENRLKAALTAK